MWHIIPLRGIKCKSDTANIVHIDNEVIIKEEDNNEYYNDRKV